MKETTEKVTRKTCTLAEAKERWHSHTKSVVSDFVWEAYKKSGLRWSQRNGYWLAGFQVSETEIHYLVYVKDHLGLVSALDYHALLSSEREFLNEVEYECE